MQQATLLDRISVELHHVPGAGACLEGGPNSPPVNWDADFTGTARRHPLRVPFLDPDAKCPLGGQVPDRFCPSAADRNFGISLAGVLLELYVGCLVGTFVAQMGPKTGTDHFASKTFHGPTKNCKAVSWELWETEAPWTRDNFLLVPSVQCHKLWGPDLPMPGESSENFFVTESTAESEEGTVLELQRLLSRLLVACIRS